MVSSRCKQVNFVAITVVQTFKDILLAFKSNAHREYQTVGNPAEDLHIISLVQTKPKAGNLGDVVFGGNLDGTITVYQFCLSNDL